MLTISAVHKCGVHPPQGPLTARDKALITALKAGPLAAEPCALEDLEIMEELNVEALYEQESGVGRFSKLLAGDLRDIAAAWDAEKTKRECV